MKLPLTPQTVRRCIAALFRNAMTYRRAPVNCRLRKCRRDGFCTGPLLACSDAGYRLCASDASDCGGDLTAVPVCFAWCAEAEQQPVVDVVMAELRRLKTTPGDWVLETSRTIFSRRWRKLKGLYVADKGAAPSAAGSAQ